MRCWNWQLFYGSWNNACRIFLCSVHFRAYEWTEIQGPQVPWIAAFDLEFIVLSFMASQTLKSLFLNVEKCKECSFTEYLFSGLEVRLKRGGFASFWFDRETKISTGFCSLQKLSFWFAILKYGWLFLHSDITKHNTPSLRKSNSKCDVLNQALLNNQ